MRIYTGMHHIQAGLLEAESIKIYSLCRISQILPVYDSKLFKTQYYVDVEWLNADNKKIIPVSNPAIGEKLADNPKMVTTEAVCAVTATRITLKTKLEQNLLRNKHFQ